MISLTSTSRQPVRQPWTLDKLVHERSNMLGLSIDESTLSSYSSALNSYITFRRLHNFPIDPTPHTLSCYATYMSHHIKPASVSTYLSGIANQLEVYYPDVRQARKSPLVVWTLQGCKHLKGSPITRKLPLSIPTLTRILSSLDHSQTHDDLLFCAMICTGLYGLLRLGELSYPDNPPLRNPEKLSRRSSVTFPTPGTYAFMLPCHKTDPFFEGSRIHIRCLIHNAPDPLPHFTSYLASQDHLFPFNRELWLCKNGSVPTRSFFIKRLRLYCDKSVAGQSMRAGGATALAEAGVSPDIIQAIGHWSSETWRIYVRKNPVLIQALLFPSP